MTDLNAAEIEAYSLSDTGKVREDNQDAVWLCNPDDHTPKHSAICMPLPMAWVGMHMVGSPVH